MSSNKFYLYTNLNAVHEHEMNPESREIYLHGFEQNEHSEIEHRSIVKFIKNVHFLDRQNNQPIIIYLQSHGGSIDDGFAAYDTIKNAKSYISIVCCGYANSMASVILQAADARVMMPNSGLLLHYGCSLHEGTSKSQLSYAEELKRTLDNILNIYAERMHNSMHFSGRNTSYIRRWLDNKLKTKEDWYLNAQESIEYGLADGIYGEGKFSLDKLRGV